MAEVRLDIQEPEFSECLPYVMAYRPTLELLRQLNRETAMPWTVGVLIACCDAGVNPFDRPHWTLRLVIIETPELIDAAIYAFPPNEPSIPPTP